jgi:hypothetical protein
VESMLENKISNRFASENFVKFEEEDFHFSINR